MMTGKERIELLLELQEHPEQLTDEQIRQILADDEMRQLARQLSFAKRAFKNQEAIDHTPNVNDEWKKFAAEHAGEMEALDKDDNHRKSNFPFRKLAASFVAVLIASGLAFAAIHIVRQNQSKDVLPTANTTVVADTTRSNVKQQTTPTRHPQDTIPTEPHTFDNVPLDEMLKEIAPAYNAGVEFENESARSLRFHFVWKHEDSLTTVVEKLNTFDAVNITIDNNKLIVR